MSSTAPKNKKSSDQLKYGEGPREQYGEGYANRPEDTTEGAKNADDHGWAGGDRDSQKVVPTDRPAGGDPSKRKPESK